MKLLLLFFIFTSMLKSFGMEHIIDINDGIPPNSIESIKKSFEETCAEVCSNENIVSSCLCLTSMGITHFLVLNSNLTIGCGLSAFIAAKQITKDGYFLYQTMKKNE
jgi:hypothetical protein